jgi:hypothetical protein
MRCLAGAGILYVVVVMGGCHEPLFDRSAPRTQYEKYDRMRNRYVPLEEPDVFGRPQPALRSRLSREP